MGEQTRNMLIGLFVVVACVTIVWLIMFLKPTVGDGKQTLYVRFANINQINIGTRVLFAGKPIGEVVAIKEIAEARKKPLSDVLGEIYYFQLVLKIDSSVHVYDTDEITVQTSGLLGEKSIAIIPKVPPKGIVPKLVGSEPIYAQSVDPIQSAFNELASVSKEVKKTFQMASTWIQKNGDTLGNTISSFGSAMDEIKITVAKINTQALMDDIQTGVQQFTSTLQDIQDSIQQMKAGEVFTNAGVVLDNMKTASLNVKDITTTIAEGRGSLGKLLIKDDFYLHLSGILNKVDTLMYDINHYGILFHLNKSWQRQRSQQITTLHALDDPKNFKTYFQTEVTDINAAMSRLSILIDKAGQNPSNEKVLGDDQFRKDFRELMHQAEELSNHLKLYNQQLTETAK